MSGLQTTCEHCGGEGKIISAWHGRSLNPLPSPSFNGPPFYEACFWCGWHTIPDALQDEGTESVRDELAVRARAYAELMEEDR